MIPMAGDKRRVDVDGTGIAVVEAGEGDPIVFLHGNPTSSFLWREVLPHLAPLGRCLAPDLAGMGDSDPLPGPAMRFVDHAAFLERLLERLGVRERVVLVLHDWGSALGFDWARRHADAVRGIAYMEAIVAPLTPAHFADGGEFIGRVRGPEGERLVLEENVFIEGFLPSGVLRALTTEELDVYRRPWREPGEARRQLLVWPRELPLDGEPADVTAIVEASGAWLATTPVPKLFINAEPGLFLVGAPREQCRTWPNQRELTVPGIHFVQEDSPDQIGTAIAAWVRELP
ncbi:haloalkane dehalogenase [Asanoa ferruginea]|uniref:Haloalkane dehalogenase n=1 Tax=Asanoa ferruginea TaxID=53367 RepID=A0A3D9Z9M7_9ACTN|nr:haloalkane dehalogenase [Asanoa ferruginea]REF94108.1 haloalkane dehalogenase [Asanoa ferruginea]